LHHRHALLYPLPHSRRIRNHLVRTLRIRQETDLDEPAADLPLLDRHRALRRRHAHRRLSVPLRAFAVEALLLSRHHQERPQRPDGLVRRRRDPGANQNNYFFTAEWTIEPSMFVRGI